MKKFLKILGTTALLALVAIQFIRPEKNDQGYGTVTYFENETKPTAQVAAILKTNCYDCHSAQTHYPWYAQIAPVSFWLDDHIVHGKGHFDVSAWESYSIKKRDHKLEEVIEMVEQGEMPLN
ncbi:MAG: heme-binding domain-containing protein, partial [Marinirhabdus sp.]